MAADLARIKEKMGGLSKLHGRALLVTFDDDAIDETSVEVFASTATLYSLLHTHALSPLSALSSRTLASSRAPPSSIPLWRAEGLGWVGLGVLSCRC